MGVETKTNFRAVNFGGGGGSSGGSFSDRLARKDRNKELDARADAKDIENLRRYEISQAELANNKALAATELAYQHNRQSIADGYAADKEGRAVEDQSQQNEKHKSWQIADALTQKDNTRVDTIKQQAFDVSQNLPEIIGSVSTERTDALARMMDQAAAAGPAEDANGKTELDRLNDVTVNAHEMNKLNLDQVTDPSGYATKLTHALLANKTQPAQIDAIVKTLTTGAASDDVTREASLKAGLKMANETYKNDIAANKLLEKPGEFDSTKIAKSDIMKNLGNPWTDSFEGFKINADKEPTGYTGKNEDIGEKELIPALTQIASMKFPVGYVKDKNGDNVKDENGKFVTERVQLTQSQIMEVLENSKNDRFLISNVLDAGELLAAADFIAKRDKNKPRKRTSAELAKQNQEVQNLLNQTYAKSSQDKELRKLFKMD